MELKEQDKKQMLVIQDEGSISIRQAEDYSCSQESDLDVGSQLTQQINHKKNNAKAFFDYIKSPLNELKKRVTTAEKLVFGNYDSAKRIVADKMNDFIKIKEEEQKAEAEKLAAEQQENQRKKIEAMNKRLDKIAASQTDVSKQIAELEAILEDEDDSLTAEEAEVIRNKLVVLSGLERKLGEQAEDVVIKAEEESVPVMPKTTIPKVKGMRKKTEYDIKVVNKKALLQAIITGQVPEDVVDANIPNLRRLAKAGHKIINGVKITITEGY